MLEVPIFVQVLGVILGWYALTGSVFMFVIRRMWKKSGNPRYLKIIGDFEEDQRAAMAFGALWSLTFTFLVLHYYMGNGTTFKERVMEAAAINAEDVLKGRE